ncbi:MAG: hypothetical protein ACR2HJ_10230 [Fimbriimonadales bacterium]
MTHRFSAYVACLAAGGASAGQYEVLDTRLATTSDDTVNVNVTSNTSRFIEAGTLAIRCRVSYTALGATFIHPWLGRIDRAWWSFPG